MQCFDSTADFTFVENNNYRLKMIVAYDGRAAISRAKDLQCALARRCRGEVTIEDSTWNFMLLAHPHLRKQAAIEAAGADIIVIAGSEAGELPIHVQVWVKDWLTQIQGKTAALVVLMDPEDESVVESHAGTDFLRRVATRHGVDFFCHGQEILIPLSEIKRQAYAA